MNRLPLALCAATALLGAALPAQADDWAEAQAAFADYDNQRGLALLERAAQAGDVRAQLAWGLALRHGQRLFPPGLAADPAAARTWIARALDSGCSVAGIELSPVKPAASTRSSP